MSQSEAFLGACAGAGSLPGPKERVVREWKEEDATCSTNGDDLGDDGDVDRGPGADGEAAAFHSGWGTSAPTHPAAPLWHSGPSHTPTQHQDAGVMSYSVGAPGGLATSAASRRTQSQHQLGAKVEMVYGLLSMLGTYDREEMSRTLLLMSSSADSCVQMRQSGCLPLLVQLLHGREHEHDDPQTRARAAQALHNIVNSHPDEKRGRREARVLRLLQQIRLYCDQLSSAPKPAPPHEEGDRNPGPTIAALMKLSFDEEHRHAMCLLGGLHAISYLIQVDHEAHGSTTDNQYCVTLRRYAGMALTNLTFGDGTNKTLLCSFRQLMRALVAQLASPSEDLRQVTASVLRNLSWRADSQSKQTLREVGAVAALMQAAMGAQKESTLKSILSALWNLSAHCGLNKMDVCAVDGALPFLVQMLTYDAPSKTLAIVENAGGILRNISSHVAVREDYRAILRENKCLEVLLQQLKSPSLTVVSNACGTLWNLSAHCQEDQRALWALGAPGMLRNLIHSKHKMISMGSSAALKNLLSAKPENDDSCFRHVDSTARSMGLSSLPGLHARKQKALEQELDQTLAETCDNIEPSTSPTTSTVGLRDDKFVLSLTERDFHRQPRVHNRVPHKTRTGIVSRSDSKESITSTHSDSVYERLARMNNGPFDASPLSESRGFQMPGNMRDETKLHASFSDSDRVGSPLARDRNSMSDRRFLRRYNNSMARGGRYSEDSHSSTDVTCDSNQNASVLGQIIEAENGMASMNIECEPPPSLLEGGDDPPSRSEDERVPPIGSDGQKLPPRQAWENESSSVKTTSSSSEKELDCVQTSTQTSTNDPPKSVSQRNKCTESGFEEDLENPRQDKPIDFARRYPSDIDETVPISRDAENVIESGESTELVGEYAETDLDQIVNYSLQYGEDDGRLAAKVDATELCEGQAPISIHEDTVKTYCTEDTPYETPRNFSSATSLSDLSAEPSSSKNAAGRGRAAQPSEELLRKDQGKSDCSETKNGLDKQGKSVKSEPFSNETPLMYSRTSSLASLSSFEQHSIADDRSSVVSDVSRLTSGAMSPSELPDSASAEDAAAPSRQVSNSRSSTDENRPGGAKSGNATSSKSQSVFADGMIAYRDEGTPTEFSRATSLSSLSFDEEARTSGDSNFKDAPKPAIRNSTNRVSVPRNDGMEKVDPEKELPTVKEGDEDDDNTKNSTCIPLRSIPTHRSVLGQSNLRQAELQESAPRKLSSIAGSVKSTGIPVKTGKIPVAARQSQPNSESIGVCDDSIKNYCTEDTPVNISCSGSQSDLSMLSPRAESEERFADSLGRELSDDAASLSGDNENILAECIQLGMPKAKPQREGNKPLRNIPKATGKHGASQHVPLVNQVLNRNVFPTECPSAGNSSVQRMQEKDARGRQLYPGVDESRSPETNGGRSPNPDCGEAVSLRSSDSRDSLQQLTQSSVSEEVVTVLSRNASLSSLSVESLGCEPSASEQALLEQCISSGMRKSRGVPPVTPKARTSRLSRAADRPGEPTHSENIAPGPSKNVQAPSVAALSAVASKEEKQAAADEKDPPSNQDPEETDRLGQILEAWTEDSEKKFKFSEDFVDVMKQSTNSGHTWEDDCSPNELSVASVSLTAPIGGSIKSENYRELSNLVEEEGNSASEAPDLHSMTDSKMLELEAGRLIEAVRYQDHMADSLNSLELDGIQPPSEMDSLVSLSQSYSGNWNNTAPPAQNNGLSSKKKPLPAGMVARRALSNSAGGLESNDLSSSSNTSHLDNVKAPSLFDEMGDMENSFLSVASISSEVADHSARDNSIGDATFELIRPAAQLIAAECAKEANRLQNELDLVNPSTYDEITDIATEQDSTMEPGTETLALDTDLNDDMVDTRTLEAPDLPCDSQHTTPASSAESTPKKTKIGRARPTPKQRREMAPDRYQTYTIGSELDRTENTLMEVEDDLSVQSLEEDETLNKENVIESPKKRMTPKQRRQEDRSRFQTQTLGKDVQVLAKPEQNDTGTEEESATSTSKTIKSAIPMFRKSGRERYRTRTLSSDSSTTITASFSQAQPASLTAEDLERGANIVINTLNENQVSVSHDNDDILDCETLSLLSESDSEPNSNSLNNNRQRALRNDVFAAQPMNLNDSEPSSESENEEEKACGPLRPRIIKPGEAEPVAESPKGIRGRRKPLYSSPAKSVAPSRSVTNPPSPPVRPRAASTPNPTRTPSTSLTTSPRTTSPRGVVSRRGAVPVPKSPHTKPGVTASKLPMRPLERQGTFTKEEPTTQGILPSSPSKTRIPVPASMQFKKPLGRQLVAPNPPPLKAGFNAKPKPGPVNHLSKPLAKTANSTNFSLRKSASASSGGTFTRSGTVPGTRRTAPASPQFKRGSFSGIGSTSALKMKTSLSNQSLKNHDRSRLEEQRSNSNSSINSMSSGKGGKKEVTSKIASLWKRVEQSRNQQQRTKDNRVWITPKAKDSTDGNEPVEVESLPSKMIRSATFEGLPSKTDQSETEGFDDDQEVVEVEPVPAGEKTSGILNGHSTIVLRRRTTKPSECEVDKEEEEVKRISRLGTFIQVEEGAQPDGQKKISKSAIVPPYNYYPPQPIDASNALKRSDSYVNSMAADRQTGTELETASVRVTTV